jgi:hypothetical protein
MFLDTTILPISFAHVDLSDHCFRLAPPMSSSTHDIVLHATPPFGGLPASDVESLYLAAVLQSALPGRWAITSGEWATNGGECGGSRRVCKATSPASMTRPHLSCCYHDGYYDGL